MLGLIQLNLKNISYRDPGTGNHLVNGRPLVRVCFETKLDEVFTLGGDIGPLGLGELVLARPRKCIKLKFNLDKYELFGAPDPLFHPRRNWLTMMRVKWRVSANTEIEMSQ